MSAVINAFLADLRQQTSIDSELRGSIYPIIAPENVQPVIVYLFNDGVRTSTYKGSYGLKTTTIALNMYHTNYDTLVSTRESLEMLYHGFSGELQDENTTIISRIEMGDAFFTSDRSNDKLYRCTVELDLIT